MSKIYFKTHFFSFRLLHSRFLCRSHVCKVFTGTAKVWRNEFVAHSSLLKGRNDLDAVIDNFESSDSEKSQSL
jgi:hypothetical protein